MTKNQQIILKLLLQMHNLDYANVEVSPAVDFKATRMELELSLIPEGGGGGREEDREEKS